MENLFTATQAKAFTQETQNKKKADNDQILSKTIKHILTYVEESAKEGLGSVLVPAKKGFWPDDIDNFPKSLAKDKTTTEFGVCVAKSLADLGYSSEIRPDGSIRVIWLEENYLPRLGDR